MAVHPKHLSVWERMRGQSKSYNPELDLKQQIEDMRADWERVEAERSDKEAAGSSSSSDDGLPPHDLDLSPEIHDYFRAQSPRFSVKNGNAGPDGEKTGHFSLPDARMKDS